jgi:hypothetical protein
MVNPFYGRESRLSKLLEEMKKKDGLEAKSQEFTDWERSAQLVMFQGYTFMVAIEELWQETTEEKLKNIDFVVRELVAKIKAKLANK